MTGTDLYKRTHKSVSRSYLNHLVISCL